MTPPSLLKGPPNSSRPFLEGLLTTLGPLGGTPDLSCPSERASLSLLALSEGLLTLPVPTGRTTDLSRPSGRPSQTLPSLLTTPSPPGGTFDHW